MKKLFTLIAVLMLTLGAAADSGIKLTFSNVNKATITSGTGAVSGVNIKVTDLTGTALDNVTATLTSVTSFTGFQTSNVCAGGTILAPNAGFQNSNGGSATFTFTISGLSSVISKFNKVDIGAEALNSAGNYQHGQHQAEGKNPAYTFAVKSGTSASDLASFGSVTDNTFNWYSDATSANANKRNYSTQVISGSDQNVTQGAIVIQITATKANGVGCYFGIEDVTIKYVAPPVPTHTVTWQLKENGEGEALYTYTTSGEENATVSYGGTIAFPYTTFTTPDAVTVGTADQTIVVPVAFTNLPFTRSTKDGAKTWYYIRSGNKDNGNKFLNYDASVTNHIPAGTTSIPTGQERQYRWAFIGNPIQGFQIINQAQSEAEGATMQYIYAASTTAKPVMSATEQPGGGWQITQGKASVKNVERNYFGFNIKDGGTQSYWNWAGDQLSYWTTPTADDGSNWFVEEAPMSFSYTLMTYGHSAGATFTLGGEAIASGETKAFDTSKGLGDLAVTGVAQGYDTEATLADNTFTVTFTDTTALEATHDGYIATFGEAATSLEEGKWYVIKNTRDDNGGERYVFNNNGNYNVQQPSASTFASGATVTTANASYLFRLTPTGTANQYYLQSGDGKYFGKIAHNTTLQAATAGYPYNIEVVDGETQYFSVVGLPDDYVLNNNSGLPGTVTGWEKNKPTSKTSNMAWQFLPVTFTVDLTEYQRLDAHGDSLYSYAEIGEGLNQYSHSNKLNAEEAKQELQRLLAKYESAESADHITENSTVEQVSAAVAAIKEELAKFTLNMPKAGTFLRLKGKSSNLYMTAPSSVGGNGTITAQADSTQAATIWYYDGNNLLSYVAGQYAGQDKAVTNEETAVHFAANGLLNCYSIYNGEGRFYYSSTDAGKAFDRNGSATATDNGAQTAKSTNLNDEHCAWTLEQVSDLPVALHKADNGYYYSTICLPATVYITSDDNVTAYAVTSTESNTAQLTAYSTADESIAQLYGLSVGTTVTLIAKEQGAVLVRKSGEDGNVTLHCISATTSSVSGNQLQGAWKAEQVTTDNYYLGQMGGNTGFYLTSNTSRWITNRAYLPSTAGGATSSSSKGFTFSFDDHTATAINGIANENGAANAARYNMQGQRVGTDYKGVVIVGGRKVLQK